MIKYEKSYDTMLLLLGGGALLARSGQAAQAVRTGLALCAESVVPSLFPFFVVTALAVRLDAASALQKAAQPLMGPLFRLRGICALPLLAGALGGYPTGAKAAADLFREGAVTAEEAETLLGFCNNCGPAFILGFVGSTVLQSSRAGLALYLIHILSALAAGAILCRIRPGLGTPQLPCRLPRAPASLPAAFTSAVSGALGSTLNICAYVLLFQVVTALLPPGLPAFLPGLLEMVGGTAALHPGRAGFITAAGILGWGGLCVHCQTMAVTEGLRLRRYWAGKTIQCVLSVLLAAIVS